MIKLSQPVIQYNTDRLLSCASIIQTFESNNIFS